MVTELEMRPAITAWLEDRGMIVLHETQIKEFVNADLLGFRFAKRVGRPIPRLLEVIVIESKIKDISGVITQAMWHVGRCTESICAMPEQRCGRMQPNTLRRFADNRIGLIGVDGRKIRIVVPARRHGMATITNNRDLARRLWRCRKR